MARRTRPVRKLLDEPLKVAGILTLRSCGIVFCAYGVSHFVLELVFGLWSKVLGDWALLGPLVTSAMIAIVLRLAEAFDDEHTLPAAVRFFATRRARHVYAAGAPDYFGRRVAGPLDSRQGSHRAVPEWMATGLGWRGMSAERS